MMRCLFIKRKLYDYLDNSLSERDRIKVKNHLDTCGRCNKNLEALKTILNMASEKNLPQTNSEFWHNFKINLDRKLNEELVGPIIFKPRLTYRLKSVFAYALILLFILSINIYFSKERNPLRLLAQEDDTLIEEIILLDELSKTSDLNYDEESLNEEIELLSQLDSSAT